MSEQANPIPIPADFVKINQLTDVIVEVHVSNEKDNAWYMYRRLATKPITAWKFIKRIDINVDERDETPLLRWIAFDRFGVQVFNSKKADLLLNGMQKSPPTVVLEMDAPVKDTIEETNRIVVETSDAIHWAVRRSCKQLQHTSEKIGDYPDHKFENVDGP